MIILLALFMSQSFAQTISIQAPCSDKVLWQQELQTLPLNLGEATIQALNTSGLQYQGNERGINQIHQSPLGLAALEILSDNEMISYGWCFQVNGVVPEIYADEIELNPRDEVLWFYGFAHYKNGDWISQCENSASRAASEFCSDI